PVGPVTDHGDGTYTATITPSASPDNETAAAGDEVITASDRGLTSTAVLHEVPVSLNVQLTPDTVIADGTTTSTITVNATNAQGAPLPGQPVTVVASGDAAVGPVSDGGDGSYAATITASTT